MDGLSWDDTWGLELDSLSLVTLDWSKSIDGVSKWINDSSEHTFTNGNIDDGSSSLDNITLLNLSIVTQDDDTDVISLEVQGHTLDSRAELDHLSGLHLHETEDSGNTISNGDDGTEFLEVILYV